MKSQILLLALTVAVLTSCTTSYKTGQTPDDVYFSPVRQQDEYVQNNDRKDPDRYESREEYYDDRYLHMRVADRQRWSELDDYYYFGNRYDYSYYNSFYWNNPWSPCSYWNNYYNPYYHSTVLVTPQSPVFNHPRTVNLNTFNNNMLTSSQYTNPAHPGFNLNGAPGKSNSGGYQYNYNNSSNTRSNSNSGSFLRNVFNNSGSSGSSSNNSSSSGSRPASTSSSSSSSGSSSGSSSAPVRRF